MKKIISVLALVSVLSGTALFAENSTSSDEAWSKINEQGAAVLRETGKFLQAITKQAGETIANGVNELSKVQCVGSWSYTSDEKIKTTITVTEDGEFSLVQKKGLESLTFKGTCSGTAHILNIKLSEGLYKTFFKTKNQSIDNLSLVVTYQVAQNKQSCNFAISGFMNGLDSTDFSEGIDFTKVN